MPYVPYNPNPKGSRVGDCTVRALSKALDKSWAAVYAGLAAKGYEMADMPSSNTVWGAYLREHGFRRDIVPMECPDCYTVADFARDHPQGTFVLALRGHVLTIQDGSVFDSWDSTSEHPLYFWHKEATKNDTLPHD